MKKILSIASCLMLALAACPPAFAADPAAADLEIGQGTTFDGANRTYLRTVRGDFADQSFQAETTVTIPNGKGPMGCAYFGLGIGQANPQVYQEPATQPALYLRMCPGDFAGGQLTAGDTSAPGPGSGSYKMRLTWDSATKRALFEVGDKHAVLAMGNNLEFGQNGHLFLGGAEGVVFGGLAVKPMTAAQIKEIHFGELFPKDDPTARTWLPTQPATANGERVLVCWYNGPQLLATRPFADGALKMTSSQWACDTRDAAVPGDPDARDITYTVTLRDGFVRGAGVTAAFDFADWSAENYVLIPGSVYNGNRQRFVGGNYSDGLPRTDLYRKDLPLSVRPLKHLEVEAGKPSRVETDASLATTPGICIFNPKIKRGFILLAEQGQRVGGEMVDNGFIVEESPDRSRATLAVQSFGGAWTRGIDWKAGDALTMRMRVYSFEAQDIPALLDKFMTVRKAFSGPNQPRNLIPASEVAALMTRMIDGQFIKTKEFQYYGSVNAPWLRIGWVGGLMNTFPMLALGDATHLDRVTRTFDFAIPRVQGKGGYFYEVVEPDGSVRAQEAYRELPELSLTRGNGDALFWMIKQFKLLKVQGRGDTIKPVWEQSIRRLADAFVATWKKDGEWGRYVNVDTGEVAEYNSTGGAMAIGGLSLAGEYFQNPEYLRVAREAADFYYQRDFVKLGMTTGGCADILANADSETAAGFMTALMALHEVTGEAQWLDKSRNLANLLATWITSYDYALPPGSELGQLGAKMAGTGFASTQNKHGAPGLCTSSCDPLFKIYRATGDRRYAQLMRDIVHAHREGIQPGGGISERLNYCNSGEGGGKGSRLGGGSTPWCGLNGILMALELPGVYVRTDKDELYVFDSIKTKVIKRAAAGVTLALTNPTKFDAKVSLFAEDAKQAKKPQGYTAFLDWPKITVNAGETKIVEITKQGIIK